MKRLNRDRDGTGMRRLVDSRHDFWGERLKATQPRVKILDLLKESYKPLSIAEIQEKAALPHHATVYRTLNQLLKMGTVRKLHGLNRKKALFEIKPVLLRRQYR